MIEWFCNSQIFYFLFVFYVFYNKYPDKHEKKYNTDHLQTLFTGIILALWVPEFQQLFI